MPTPAKTRTRATESTTRASRANRIPAANQAAAYSTAVSPEARLLGAILGEQPSGYRVAEIVERGLPTASVEILRKEGLTFSEVHDLVLPARTLKHRKEKKQPLSSEETGRALRVARVLALAEQVFGNHEKALGWLRRPNRRLKDRPPIELLRSEAGGELIRTMLWQIDEGIYV